MAFRFPVSFLLLSPLRIAARSGVWSRAMSIKVGDSLPEVLVFDGGPGNKTSLKDVFGSEKGILFGVPGAFTPGCSKTHLPGYVSQAEDLKTRGVKVIACISVNDPFVMKEWGNAHNAEGKVRMLADPTGDFVKAAGLGLNKEELLALFGTQRCQRFSLIVDCGKVKAINVEEDGTGLTCSLAGNILSQL
ncbi:PREDICTED: peroxiredoxin-5, mitochondrial [Nanorana parkeri]|uniref:peroxiredoxin-5, mitochondrial n=1 Tax=Nanorana parkeri TaxID=125878 RepID=UPI0008540B95|nr:PREDICTED: peroxiredoxin-5, mitochondrial [Nanorana parkeri]